MEKYLNFIEDLRNVREQIYLINDALGIDLGDIQTGYEAVIDDLLKINGLSDGEIDLVWEMTEPCVDCESEEDLEDFE